MPGKKKTAVILSTLFLVTLACSVSSLVGGDPDILYQDDFSTREGGWAAERGSTGIVDYDQDAYRIQVLMENSHFWSVTGLNYADTTATVETRMIGGPDENLFGLICRHNDDQNFYAFFASSDGFFGITRFQDDQVTVLNESGMLEQTPAIEQGAGAVNFLQADCIGSTLTFTINGTEVLSVQDTSFSSGDIGLIAGTYEETGTDILFDNLVIRKP